MRMSNIPLSRGLLRTNGSILDCTDQLTPIATSYGMNGILWNGFLNIQEVIRDELGKKFPEVDLPTPIEVAGGFFSRESTPSEEEIAVKYIQETVKGGLSDSKCFFYFNKKLQFNTSHNTLFDNGIQSNANHQLVVYSFTQTDKEMYEQGKVIKALFKKIFERIGLPAFFVQGLTFSVLSNETIMSLFPNGNERLLYYPDSKTWSDKNVLILERELMPFDDEEEILKSYGITSGLYHCEEHCALKVGEFIYWGQVKTRYQRFMFDSIHSPFFVGKYIIDLSRAMDALIYHNTGNSGFVWPYDISPYQLHMICSSDRMEKAEYIYDELRRKKISVLFDDRDIPFDEKIELARLLGIPKVIVINDDTNRTDGGVFLVNRETWEQDYTNYVEILKSPDGL